MLIDKIKEYFNHVNNVTQMITGDNIEKIISYIKQIPMLCSINMRSNNNKKLRDSHSKKYHPVKVFKGEIYNAQITENAGSELSNNHFLHINILKLSSPE